MCEIRVGKEGLVHVRRVDSRNGHASLKKCLARTARRAADLDTGVTFLKRQFRPLQCLGHLEISPRDDFIRHVDERNPARPGRLNGSGPVPAKPPFARLDQYDVEDSVLRRGNLVQLQTGFPL